MKKTEKVITNTREILIEWFEKSKNENPDQKRARFQRLHEAEQKARQERLSNLEPLFVYDKPIKFE